MTLAVSSWGRLSSFNHELRTLVSNVTELPNFGRRCLGLAYGNGRSYGDVCLNPGGGLWQTTGMNRFISFDEVTGILRCEAGLLLRDIQTVLMPRGWMLPVSPGTQLITVGGAIANDVHGKNHHRVGTFANHVAAICLLRTDGEQIVCGPTVGANWFAATVGGLGLTGVIVWAELQLRRVSGPWLDIQSVPYQNLGGFFELADRSEAEWEYTVSWIDCMSGDRARGVFMRGNHNASFSAIQNIGKRLSVPFVPPVSLVNRITLRPFNMAYFHLRSINAGSSIVHYEKFFYPLDNILNWNRIYGPHGFYQYQSVVPRAVGRDATEAMLREIGRSGYGSFLAVLKTFGDRQPIGLMSFPQPGVTLALDFPNKGDRLLKLFARLDAIVREAKGRIYAAKDARMPQDLFTSGYPRLAEFFKYRDPGISSALSRRLMGS